ncbi:hypothetical protein MUO14_06040 [Halobacillus shinanisalinarum]|uniref:DUF3813 domain-containing protein n=1 Tax=Halobacillus shinanisalinarum TaxID=2932258 RepID=A0ABY4H241_9BACI|nr:hypothetical protein [Halobacillus shinanisalinarum]UOQ94512.1 hypothetical protein MUO14_06040 [Halobacillus shinanisalinarum]
MNFDHVKNQLSNAQRAVERAQEDRAGFVEAQTQVKLAEEELAKAKHDPSVNTEENAQQIQRATDLLRLIEETNQANNR